MWREIAQWVKGLADKPDTLSWTPGAHKVEEEN